jgi:hypothetical protein
MNMDSMETIPFGRWELYCTPEITRQALAAVPLGSPEECGCEPCLNFVAADAQIYGIEVLEIFKKLGIPPDREVEIYRMGRMESGRHHYGGWFHLVGSLVSGEHAAKQVAENTWQPDLEKTDEYFQIGFSSQIELIQAPFKNLPLIQLEFIAEVPWVLDSPEPSD